MSNDTQPVVLYGVPFSQPVRAVMWLLLPAVIASADWARFSRSRGETGGRAAAAAPLVMVPVAIVIAFAGALIASAAQAVIGGANGSPIADGRPGPMWRKILARRSEIVGKDIY